MTVVDPLLPVLWSPTHKNLWRHMPLYTVMANIITVLAKQGVPVALGGGSYLGSVRHHGHVPMLDKDGDLWVFSTNTSLIESALNSIKGEEFHWTAQNDGIGNSNSHTGFGYHINVKHDMRYLDLWLYEHMPDVFCSGRQGGCLRWFNKYMPGQLPHYKTEDYFPLALRPFGPYLMPAPHGDRILLAQYGDTWNSTCMGWQKGNTPCAQFYETYPFVFVREGVEILKQGNEDLQRFDQTTATIEYMAAHCRISD